MDSPLHLLPLPDTHPPHHPTDIFATGTPLLIPLGAGLVTGIRERRRDRGRTGVPDGDLSGDRTLTTDDLVARDTTVGGLWADAALTMLDTLGRLTAAHGTALRRRRLTDPGRGYDGIREIGVIDDPFPAAGLLAHPLLAGPTRRILRDTPQVAVTATGRLLVADPGATLPDPERLSDLVGGEVCSPVLTLTDGALLR